MVQDNPNQTHSVQQFLTDHGIGTSLVLGILGLGAAALLIRTVLAASPGNERMAEIAQAIQEGAKAYLHRQLVTVLVIAALIFAAIF